MRVEAGAQDLDLRLPSPPLAVERWTDADGENLLALSVEGGEARARLFRISAAGAERVSDLEFPARAPGAAADSEPVRAGFYKDGAWSADLNGDGRGEAMFVAWNDESADPGPVSLELVVIGAKGEARIRGTAAFDPPGGARIPATGIQDEAMSGLDLRIREEAERLWAEALFDFAKPASFPGFMGFEALDGASFSGDKPAWSLRILPSRVELGLGDEIAPIAYDSIRVEGSGWVIEGHGKVEAWDHSLRITIAPMAAGPDAQGSYSALVEISDGSRLEGIGRLSVVSR